MAWAAPWPERAWAIEGADGVGHLLAQQLLAAGERVADVQPKLSARVRLLAAGATSKNDPDDARSVAVAAVRSPSARAAAADDHAAVLRVWSKRHRDLGRLRTQLVCRLHAVLRAAAWRGRNTDDRRPGRAAAGAGHHLRRGRGGPPRARRPVHRRPARHRRADARHQQEAHGRRPGGRDQPDRAVRGRPGDRRHGHRRRPRRVPLPWPRSLRRLERHRAGRGFLRAAEDLPAVPAR
jgi:hypothetical protein